MADTSDHPCRYSLQRFCTATAGCACTPWYECEESYSRSSIRSRVNSNRNRWREALLLRCAEFFGVTVTIKSKQRCNKESLTQRCVCVGCQLNSDQALRLRCLRKNTSERKARRYDDTSRQEASEFLCIKTPLFLRESSNIKNCPKIPEMLSPTRY